MKISAHWIQTDAALRRVVVIVCLALAACGKKEEEPAVKPVVEVQIAKAEVENFETAVSAPATIFPREQANIAARTAAPIKQLLVKKGDSVKAGQTVAVLESRDVAAAREEAVASLAEAQETLQKTTSAALPTDVERARGQMAVAEATLRQAQTIYDRRKKLFEQGAIPQRDLLASETDVATNRANYEVAKTTLDLLKNQSRDRDIKIAQSHVEAAKARLRGVDAQMIYTQIVAPFSGSITEQFMYPGDMAKPDAPMFTIMDLSTAVARAQVPESAAAPIKPGQLCSFTSGDNAAAPYSGRISVINRAVDPARRTLEVWCEIASPPPALRAGSFGQVKVAISSSRSVVVPQAAVQLNEGARTGFVMVVSGKTVKKRDIEAGEAADGKMQILKGINAGETVVTEGVYGLAEGVEIKLASDKKDDKGEKKDDDKKEEKKDEK